MIGAMDDDTCECAEHGFQPIAFVCTHIVATTRGDTVGFASYAPESAQDQRDAWCGACDAYLQNHGGEWVEGSVEVPGGVSIICAECYRGRERDAERADQRVIHRIS